MEMGFKKGAATFGSRTETRESEARMRKADVANERRINLSRSLLGQVEPLDSEIGPPGRQRFNSK